MKQERRQNADHVHNSREWSVFRLEPHSHTVYPKKYVHGFVVLCFVVVMQSFIMNSHEVFIHIHKGCFAGTGAIVRLPQCQWSKPDGYGKISQCITTTKHSKAKPCAYFLGYTVFRDHTFGTSFFTWLNFIPGSISNYIHYQMCHEISQSFPKIQCADVEICELICCFIPHIIRYVIGYLCWD